MVVDMVLASSTLLHSVGCMEIFTDTTRAMNCYGEILTMVMTPEQNKLRFWILPFSSEGMVLHLQRTLQ